MTTAAEQAAHYPSTSDVGLDGRPCCKSGSLCLLAAAVPVADPRAGQRRGPQGSGRGRLQLLDPVAI
ncbi:MAG: hypothetical protein QOI76_4305 [Frankiales bacterium]|jgi:hypothetical protein|nr:hypothetical protein [Frankiales bacterium]